MKGKVGHPLVAWTVPAVSAKLPYGCSKRADSSLQVNGENVEQDEQRRPKWG
jgi:hypothetical protein